MNKLPLILLACVLLPGCDNKSDEALLTEAKTSVKSALAKEYKPGECENWRFMESAGTISQGASKVVCDRSFNISKGVEFHDVKIFRHEGKDAVCGIVSGETDLSRIGARFVYVDADESTFLKMSRHPGSFRSNESRHLTSLIIDNFNKSQERWCK
ncbi:hypothetical protein QD242_003002 [Salmonella enterica]|uniref:hypothetical protein n=1 Tax=Salmonella enterica TaxID=28901 RepID=UPI001078CD36|nr:hypothetical protein [Salmonella enterica subsp. enterica serovar Cerro]EAT9391674.1 hypothetical protein [Salmonella enterica]EBG2809043.1 hypothetical protein [Salmonella enterica subsp. enterica serovar Infantis]EBG5673755.1 hypothetical protein [Salmonella enterica subsp. enterica serovar Montevideo]EBQ9805058.1 hypothetical protein [Salmonella enterica subsp. enterica serovar Rissen]EBV7818254.1 hypothetical protein [Salmonella enterica subsp. enterica serovar Havana]EBZ1826196.1 hypo